MKEIAYDRQSRDYAMYLDGELVGFARTYHEAETELDTLIYDRIRFSTDDLPTDGPGQEDDDPGTGLPPKRLPIAA